MDRKPGRRNGLTLPVKGCLGQGGLFGAVLALLLCIVPSSGVAHSGFLDKNGCHNNNKKLVYECHDGLLKGQTFKTQAEALKALAKTKKPAAATSGKSAPAAPSAPAGQKQNPSAQK